MAGRYQVTKIKVEQRNQIKNIPAISESIDFSKLIVILRNNWIWIALIFIVINSASYLIIRYTKNLYQADSEIKLDIKSDASVLGMKNVFEDQYLNLISGEIEIIQSKLFLYKVVEESDFGVTFMSVGRVLNQELYPVAPASVLVHNRNHSLYNVPIYFYENDRSSYTLAVGEQGKEIKGKYNEKLQIEDLHLTLTRNDAFVRAMRWPTTSWSTARMLCFITSFQTSPRSH
jgi:tyrosine-protein kinase Etk/Wzc